MIDLRSDTVTLPTDEMREASYKAQVGDDVYGEDPSVIELEALACEMSGMPAAVFASSGTQTNLIALLAHCGRGDEYIVGADAHTFKYEGGGAAVLGGIQPQTIPVAEDGTLPLDLVEAAVKDREDHHFAKSKVFTIENTHSGRALPMQYLSDARALADEQQLLLHMDGARVFNAVTAHNTTLKAICEPLHSISICLSKGLSAPVGSVLCGDADFIQRARRWRKVTGGGMRQAGVIAAPALIALRDMPARLQQDHDHAALLAKELQGCVGFKVREAGLATNMVWLDLEQAQGEALSKHAAAHGLGLSASGKTARLVIHRHISTADVHTSATVIRDFFGKNSVNSIITER